MYELRVCMN